MSVPQITRLFKGGTIISSKTDPHNNGSNKERGRYGKSKNNKTLLKSCHLFKSLS